MHRFANPARFLRIAAIVLPWATGGAVVTFLLGLYLALIGSPPDYQQGDSARIMYVHFPAAGMALMIYSSMAVAAAVALVWKHTLAELYCKAAAPLGAGFTALCLITGSLWGKPMWGTYWVWDARLTATLILLFVYVGYMALVNAFDEPGRGERMGSILLLIGAVDVPIIHFSVEWWNTLHQPSSVFKIGGPTIVVAMLYPLLAMAVAYLCYFVAVVIVRMRAELVGRRIQALRMAAAAGE